MPPNPWEEGAGQGPELGWAGLEPPSDTCHLSHSVPPLPRDKGMRHMVGADWRQLFDVVIVQADKPSFFTDRRKYGPGRGDGPRERGLASACRPVCLGWGHPLADGQVSRWAFAEWEVSSLWSCHRLEIRPFNPTLGLSTHPRPFRKLDEKGSLHWDRITRLEKGKIYRQVRVI